MIAHKVASFFYFLPFCFCFFSPFRCAYIITREYTVCFWQSVNWWNWEKKTTENNRSVCTYGSKWIWSRWNVPAYTKSDTRRECVHKQHHKARLRRWEELYRDRWGGTQHFCTFAKNMCSKRSVFILHCRYYTVIKVLWTSSFGQIACKSAKNITSLRAANSFWSAGNT